MWSLPQIFRQVTALAFAWRNQSVEYLKMYGIQAENQTWDLVSAKPERKP
jgi:hypothetical protein